MAAHKLINLDGMRGIAALFVFFRHTGELWGVESFFHSYLAVDVFFILSGFVIAYSYDHRLASEAMSSRAFVITRLIRLYPMYFLGLVLGFIYYCVLIKLNLRLRYEYISADKLYMTVLLSSLFLPTNVGPGQTLFPLNGASWSLFYELCANFLYVITRRLLSPLILMGGLLIGIFILAYCAFKLTHLDVGALGGIKAMFAAGVRAVFSVFFGVLLFKIYVSIRLPVLSSRFAVVVLLLVSLILMTPSLGAFNWVFDVLIIALVMPALILLAAYLPTPASLVKPFIFLGFLSYPLYILHGPLLGLFMLLCDHEAIWYKHYAGWIFFVIVIAVGVASVRYIDEPLRQLLKNKFLAKYL